MYYLYILKNIEFDLFYVGYSSDPWNRLQQHNSNTGEKFTGKYSDWELASVFEVSENKSEAIKIEKFIKKQKSRNLIERLITPEFIPNGILAQLVRVPHLRN